MLKVCKGGKDGTGRGTEDDPLAMFYAERNADVNASRRQDNDDEIMWSCLQCDSKNLQGNRYCLDCGLKRLHDDTKGKGKGKEVKAEKEYDPVVNGDRPERPSAAYKRDAAAAVETIPSTTADMEEATIERRKGKSPL